MKTYRTTERMVVDGKVVDPGEQIQLPDDLADMHRSRLILLPSAERILEVKK